MSSGLDRTGLVIGIVLAVAAHAVLLVGLTDVSWKVGGAGGEERPPMQARSEPAPVPAKSEPPPARAKADPQQPAAKAEPQPAPAKADAQPAMEAKVERPETTPWWRALADSITLPRFGTQSPDAPAQAASKSPDQQAAAGAPGAAQRTPVAQRQFCPIGPLLAAANEKDGQLLPLAEVTGKGSADIASSLTGGKEAAAAGRRRDAEVAFLTACRIADAVKGPSSVEAADARYQLGWHYANVAGIPGPAPAEERAQLLKRAEAFYADSHQSYTARLGAEHEKTRFASQGLDAARQRLAQGARPPPAENQPQQAQKGPATDPANKAQATARDKAGSKSTAQAPAQGPAKSAPQGAAKASPQTAAQTAARPATSVAGGPPAEQQPGGSSPGPSFDCAKARSVPEKLICADPQLSQMDRDLGRLHARAKSAAVNPAAFKRQNDSEWKRRETTCRDRPCLMEWYEQRRQQLQATLDEARSGSGRTASR